ncbi:hypothetical protein MSPP1_000378 [Malassezia sp. CBS 17886]|nr:hypothetical protein MSPP1_000378 [Malassezia sp. CBS 17886]
MNTEPALPQSLPDGLPREDDAVADALLPPGVATIPTSVLTSVSAWWHLSPRQTAESELWLYQTTPFFKGATLGNAAACTTNGPDGLADAFHHVQEARASSDTAKNPAAASKLNQFRTVGCEVAAGGKVGGIRQVDIGPAPDGTDIHRSFFRNGHAKHHINMLEIGTPVRREEQPHDERKIVLVHGYGAGTAFFFRNVETLGSIPNSRLFGLDWLGMGRSSRPPYHLPRTAARSAERVEAAESFFLTALEQWREKMEIDKMVLVGHSLGGYLSTAYALRHPERVSELILVSPVGIPEGSWDVSRPMRPSAVPESDAAELQRVDSSSTTESEKNAVRVRPVGTRTRSVLGWLWDRNVSPFGILRSSVVFGPLLMGSYTRRRFAALSEKERLCLHAYCYGVFTDRGSSEYCLADILAPGAFARQPLVHRMAPIQVPVSFLYGSNDWMDVNGAVAAKRVLAKAGNPHARIFIVPKAGHHLYLDNSPEFNKALRQLLEKRDESR